VTIESLRDGEEMENFITDALSALNTGRGLVVATIIRQMGSAPRELGTRMVISDTGKVHGTVGGGRLEADVLAAASEVSASGRERLLQFRLDGSNVDKTDMICGGNVDVFLNPVSAMNENFKNVMTAAQDVIRKGGRGLLIENVTLAESINPDKERDSCRWLFLAENGEQVGDFGLRDLSEYLKKIGGDPGNLKKPLFHRDERQSSNGLELFLMPCTARHRVILFGGGHICLHLAKLVKMVGFTLIVADDRLEYVNQDRFPDADELWHVPFNTVLKERRVYKNDYLVIVTRGHQHDLTVLYHALQTSAEYIGMIGSRRKRELIYSNLLERGVQQSALDRVHSPIGIRMIAQTPEEIAVSIVAELINERGAILKKVKDWKV
jgi:xanthine dehydrogenase accessory factor